MAKKPNKVAQARSEEHQCYVHGLRGSGAASKHTPKPRKGTRGARKRRDIQEQL